MNFMIGVSKEILEKKIHKQLYVRVGLSGYLKKDAKLTKPLPKAGKSIQF